MTFLPILTYIEAALNVGGCGDPRKSHPSDKSSRGFSASPSNRWSERRWAQVQEKAGRMISGGSFSQVETRLTQRNIRKGKTRQRDRGNETDEETKTEQYRT